MSLGWKRIEKSSPYRRGKLIMRRIAGKELWLQPVVAARPVLAGGWLYLPDRLDSRSIVYSLGVGDDITFDLALIERHGLDVYAFDPVPAVASWLETRSDVPRQFRFHPWAAAAQDATLRLYPRSRTSDGSAPGMYTAIATGGCAEGAVDVPAYSLATMTAKLGHERVDLLKVDIEGAEYDVLDAMLASRLRPTQLLVEFHHRFAGLSLDDTAAMAYKLIDEGYELLAVSDSGREYCFCLDGD